MAKIDAIYSSMSLVTDTGINIEPKTLIWKSWLIFAMLKQKGKYNYFRQYPDLLEMRI